MREPIDVVQLTTEKSAVLFDEWSKLARSGRVDIRYEAWMDQRYLTDLNIAITLRQGSVIFDMIHGVEYAVRGNGESLRRFRVQLTPTLPYISFRDAGGVLDFPWITFPGVFTQGELQSLRRTS